MGIDNPVHLLFIAVVALVVLGPRRLPELARALGKGVREFREAVGAGASAAPSEHATRAEHVAERALDPQAGQPAPPAGEHASAPPAQPVEPGVAVAPPGPGERADG